MRQECIALLGRRDEPTDGVQEYCRYLGEGLREHDFDLELARVSWFEVGWPEALRQLQEQARAWRGAWVLVQYTALAWSERGFPLRFPRVLRVLRQEGARIAMTYHDVLPYEGQRTIDKLRRQAQLHVMSHALGACDLAIFTVPVEKLSWISRPLPQAVSIPVGANLPVPQVARERQRSGTNTPMTIAVFGITGGEAGIWEIAAISEAMQYVTKRLGKLRLILMGRNSNSAEKALNSLAEKLPIELRVLGFLPEEEIADNLASSDVLLFVRGAISTRRGSAIAGIASGLPVVAFEGPETAPPITEAGVVFADSKRQGAVGEALVRILSDDAYRAALAERSRVAQGKYFSWKAISERYANAMRKSN